MTGCLGNRSRKSRRGKLPHESFGRRLTGIAFPREIFPTGKGDDGAGLLFFEKGGERLRRTSSRASGHGLIPKRMSWRLLGS
jgi:hypothetical protein